ncbi:hypothetical protein K493DRAFT_335088 [Basidiobolus meristosporus CBS 931.73]|uniref:Uncharacterized protein n=1 Tax=Basidiobolus meristosporus CBS 931.73 TaxID=1314790 RepID=A0A1Y1YSS1_9FUNG|nr:hypothetical protein K493DRAFT_335088 [Basidiobolus meristosporus CBS 931.73]|eukprot:ORY01083.1 hypothetical protein K493DRAFT_335088 [Basidiobolus meristosporus CBS 931.73]
MRASKILSSVVVTLCVMGTMVHGLGESPQNSIDRRAGMNTQPNNNFRQIHRASDFNLGALIVDELAKAHMLPKEPAKQQGLVQEIFDRVNKLSHGKSSNDHSTQEFQKEAVIKIVKALVHLDEKSIHKRQAKSIPPDNVLKAKIVSALIRRGLFPKDSAKASALTEEAFAALKMILGKKDDAKKDDAKKDDAKKDDAKKDDAKKDDAKKDDAKKDDAKKDDAKKDDAKKDDAKKDDAKKDDAKKDDAKKDDAKKDDAKKDDAKKDDAKKDDAKKDDMNTFQRLAESVKSFFSGKDDGRTIEKRQAKGGPPVAVLRAKIISALTNRGLLPKDDAKAAMLIDEALANLKAILGLPKDDAKKDDAKKDDAKKDDAKKDDAKKDDAKKDDAKKGDAKKDDAKKDDAKKDDAKKDDAKKDDAKKDDAKKDDAKKDDAKKDDAKKDDAKKDDAKKDDAKKDDAKKDDAKKDDAKKDDAKKDDAKKDDAKKGDAKKDDAKKDDAKKDDAKKDDAKVAFFQRLRESVGRMGPHDNDDDEDEDDDEERRVFKREVDDHFLKQTILQALGESDINPTPSQDTDNMVGEMASNIKALASTKTTDKDAIGHQVKKIIQAVLSLTKMKRA